MILEFLANTFGDVYERFDGAMSFTVIVISKVVFPPVFVAVTVYVANEVIAVGVPLITPVEVSRERPEGRDGEMEKDIGIPVILGERELIEVPFV